MEKKIIRKTIYNFKKTTTLKRLLLLSLGAASGAVLIGTQANPVSALVSSPNPTNIEKENSNLSTKLAEQDPVLLQNNGSALPIAKNQKVALFGGGAYGTYTGGGGSGSAAPRKSVNIWDGIKNAGYNISSTDWLNNTKKDYDQQKSLSLSSSLGPAFHYNDPQISDNDFNSAKGNVGVYVIDRSSSEGSDRQNSQGDYQLTDNEKANIQNMAKHYSKSVVLLNVPGPIDTSWIEQTKGLDSVLDVSMLGQNTGTAVANLLSGKTTPSGKLTTTWAKKYSDYPSSATFSNNDNNSFSEPYKEGIYNGYRYFDSYNKTPAYPFGYGLSYAKFKIQPQNSAIVGDKYQVSAKVTNTSKKYSGSEVVQAYYSKPKSNLPTAMQDLGTYAKTKTLKPGQSQTVKMSFPLESMASFDTADNTNKLKAGDYLVRVGNSSRNTKVVSKLNLNKDFVTEKLQAQAAPKQDPTTLKGSNNQFVPKGQGDQIAKATKLTINPGDLKTKNVNYQNNEQETKNFSGNKDSQNAQVNGKKATLKDVYAGKLSLDKFANGLNESQLSHIVEGNFNLSANNIKKLVSDLGNNIVNPRSDTPGLMSDIVPTTSGNITDKYQKDLGIPGVVLNDGPAGLRFGQTGTQNSYNKNGKTYYTYATAWPVDTAMAQSWDPENIYKQGRAVAREMKEFGINTWLAPGMNIQRNPLGGRNFEYYSEDPVLSGISATAETRGVQKTPGLGVDIKHFAANNQEENRYLSDSQVGQQALREIYLKGFEIATKDSQPQAFMSSYNKVNGTFNAASYDLLSHVLRQEWGFKGMVTTDWFNLHSITNPKDSMSAGNDLIMPGGNQSFLRVNNSTSDIKNMRRSAKRILKSVLDSDQFASQYNTKASSYTPKNVQNYMNDNGKDW